MSRTAEVSRRERKKDETRERIFQTAMTLFRERGFQSTTVDEIANQSDVAKGTFFNYFPRKEAVLQQAALAQIEELEASAEQLLRLDLPARDNLLEVFRNAGTEYRNAPELWRHMFIELLKGPTSLLFEVDSRAQDVIRRFVEHGQLRGELRSDVGSDRATYVLRGVFFTSMLRWMYRTDAYDPIDEVVAQIGLVLDGFATPEARRS